MLLLEGALMCKAGLHICCVFLLACSDVVYIEFDCGLYWLLADCKSMRGNLQIAAALPASAWLTKQNHFSLSMSTLLNSPH